MRTEADVQVQNYNISIRMLRGVQQHKATRDTLAAIVGVTRRTQNIDMFTSGHWCVRLRSGADSMKACDGAGWIMRKVAQTPAAMHTWVGKT